MAEIDVQITASPTVTITHASVVVATPDPVTEQINGVTIGTVASGDTNNQVIQNSASTPVGTEANPSVVSDSTLTINGSSIGSVAAEASRDITVNLNGSPSGSWDGDSWEVTSPTRSLSVSLSSSTPSIGDVVTITATPSNITPTGYIFHLPTYNGEFIQVSQASNIYNWTVNTNGSFTVHVDCTDGSSTAYGTASGSVNLEAQSTALIAALATAYGSSIGATQQTEIDRFFKRLKGHFEDDNVDCMTDFIADGAELYLFVPKDDSTANAAAFAIEAFNATTNVTWTNFVAGDFLPTGCTGASGKYGELTLAPSDFGQNDVGIGFYSRTWTSANGRCMGSTNLAAGTQSGGGNNMVLSVPNNTGSFTPLKPMLDYPTTRKAFVWTQRSAAAVSTAHKTGYLTDVNTGASVAPSANVFWIMADNGLTRYITDELCTFLYGASYTVAQILTFNNAIETFNQNIITGGR